MRQQRIIRHKPNKKVQIIDDRQKEIPTQNINPNILNVPVRTVNFVEVGSMSSHQIKILLEQLNKSHDTAKGGIHYLIPIRDGKIGTDILFEQEWLNVVRKTCEIQNDQIVLKNGATEVKVIRQVV